MNLYFDIYKNYELCVNAGKDIKIMIRKIKDISLPNISPGLLLNLKPITTDGIKNIKNRILYNGFRYFHFTMALIL